MSGLAAFSAIVHGLVQGVNFRYFVRLKARALGLTGFVRNLPLETQVEVVVEGEREKLEELLSYLRIGPPGAEVERVEVYWSQYTGGFPRFEVRY